MATYSVARKSAAKPDDTLLRRTYVLGDSKVKLELELPGDLPLDRSMRCWRTLRPTSSRRSTPIAPRPGRTSTRYP